MKPNSTLRSFLLACGSLLAASSLHAATNVTWDITPGTIGAGNGTVTGGTGAWNTSNGNWTTDAGANNIAWDNLNNDTAIFGGTAGTVTLGTGITAGGLTFNTANYIVAGNTITLTGTAIINAAQNVTINSILDGSVGMTKSGGASLILGSTTSTFIGGITVNGGTLDVRAANAAGADANIVTFAGNSTFTSSNVDFTIPQGVAINNGVTVAWSIGSNNTDRIVNGPLSGSGTLNVGQTKGVRFLSTANTFTGAIGLSSGIYGGRIEFNSLADSASPGQGTISFNQTGYGATTFTWGTGAVSPLTLTNRQFDIGGPGGTATIQNNNANTANIVTINSDFLSTPTGTKTLGLAGSNTGTNLVAGKIVDGGGVVNLTKSGNGTWILSNTNTYSGATTISAGTLIANSTDALGSSIPTNTLIFGGGTLQAGGTITSASTRNVSMTGAGTIHTNGNAVSIAGIVSGAGALTKSGAGTLTLTGTNTYTGTTTISAGTLEIGNAGPAGALSPSSTITNNATLAFNRNNTLVQGVDFGSVIGGSGAVIQAGVGTLVLSGANTYTGDTTIGPNGIIIAQNANALGTGGIRNVSMTTGADLSYAAAADAPLSITGNLGIVIGGSNAIIGGAIGSTATAARIDVAGDATVSATGTIAVNVFGITGVTPLAGTNTYTLVHGAGGGSAMNGATYSLGNVYNNAGFTVGALSVTANDLNVNITAATPLTAAFWKGGLTGTVYGAANVWAASDGTANSNWVTAAGGGATGLVPGSGADVTISATSVTTAPTATVLGDNMSIRSLTVADTTNGLGIVNDGNSLTIANAAGITMNASVPASSIAARVALGADQTWTNHSANTLTVSGAVSGAFGLTKAGTGPLILEGVNTYTGATVISAGTLNLFGSLTGGTAISTSGTAILFQSVEGTISGASTLTHDSSGTSTLNGFGTYTGPTAINAGTLVLTTRTFNGFTSATTINTGGTLKLGAANRFVDTAVVTVNSGGTFDLNGGAEIIARTAGTGGSVTNTGALAKLTLTGAGTQTISNVFSGALDLSIQGTSILTLTGGSNYSGSTIIGTSGSSGPKVKLGANNVLPSGTPVIGDGNSAAGTVLDLNGFNQTVGLVTLGNSNGGAQTVVGGTGTLTLSNGAKLDGHNNGAALISVTTVDLNNATQLFSITGSNNATSTLTVSSVIRNGAVTVTGGGTSSSVIFSGTNTYSGSTKTTAGILRLDNKLALQDSAVDTSGAGVYNLNALAGTYSLGGLIGTKNLSLVITTGLANMTTMNLNPQSGSVSYSGVIANGTMAVTKTGAGTQTLSGVNTYTGATLVSQGTLALVGGSHNSAIELNGGSLGFTLGSPTTSTASVTLTSGTVKITGSVDNVSDYLLLTTTATITGTPTLATPIPNYTLQKAAVNTQLKLVYTPGGSAYDTWAAAKGLDNSDAAHSSAKGDDPEGDGKNNLSEFGFDGDPLSGANDGKIVGKIATVGGNQVMTLTLPVRTGATFSPDSGDQLSALIDGIYYRIEGDESLSPFADTITEVTGGDATTIQTGLPALSSGWTYRTFRAPGTVLTTSKAFLRAKVSETP